MMLESTYVAVHSCFRYMYVVFSYVLICTCLFNAYLYIDTDRLHCFHSVIVKLQVHVHVIMHVHVQCRFKQIMYDILYIDEEINTTCYNVITACVSIAGH